MDLRVATRTIKPLNYSTLNIRGCYNDDYDYDLLFCVILTELPHIIINCSLESDFENGYLIVDNEEFFDINPNNPELFLEELKLINYLKSYYCDNIKNITGDENIRHESWFFNGNRDQVITMLTNSNNKTYCIRPSSTKNCFALSYRIDDDIRHCIIEPRKKFYFCGNVNKNKIAGLFFTSLKTFVWYWRNYGLGTTWIRYGDEHKI